LIAEVQQLNSAHQMFCNRRKQLDPDRSRYYDCEHLVYARSSLMYPEWYQKETRDLYKSLKERCRQLRVSWTLDEEWDGWEDDSQDPWVTSR